MGSIVPGGGSIKADLSGGGTTGRAEFPGCRQRASSTWRGRAPRKPGLLRGEEDPVSRSHIGSWIRGYARFLWRVSGFFTQILNPLFLVYPESFKNLGQILKQTWAKLMLSDQQLHLC